MIEALPPRCNACGRIHLQATAPCPLCGADGLRQNGGKEGLQVSDGLELAPDHETDHETGHYSALVVCLACGLHGPDGKNCGDAIQRWNNNAALISTRISQISQSLAYAA